MEKEEVTYIPFHELPKGIQNSFRATLNNTILQLIQKKVFEEGYTLFFNFEQFLEDLEKELQYKSKSKVKWSSYNFKVEDEFIEQAIKKKVDTLNKGYYRITFISNKTSYPTFGIKK